MSWWSGQNTVIRSPETSIFENGIGSVESVISLPVSKGPCVIKFFLMKRHCFPEKNSILLPKQTKKLKNKINRQENTQESTTVTKLIPSLSHIFSPEA